ncbi:lipoprotein [Rhodopirellula maiorica SM1]|uniref:Lipoprotein n=1 Tax=Rhodopirellula maiorica SM1 TaxID=1265738 RepID=M5S1U5_9BACT|nr:SMP-30/gluconolactonase/LRE family protein [Rhodopirellula maiorica]EMI20149.1 lipoprotein [Rhodopirellula maiorica SM1]
MDADFQLVDGAAWDGRNLLYAPDVKAKQLTKINLATLKVVSENILKEPLGISGTCYQLGKLYLSDNANSRIAILGPGGKTETLAQFEKKQRPNDLVVDSSGTVYATFTGEGIVRSIDANGNVLIFATKLDTPNGIALSPDESTLYVSSHKSGALYEIPIDRTKKLQTAKRFAQLKETEEGFRGDGMCIDRAGNVYCTGANAVYVFDPDGNLRETIPTPARPINAIIAGSEGRTLFISTFDGLYYKTIYQYGVLPQPAPETNTNGQSDQGRAGELSTDRNVVYANVDGRKLLMDVFRPTAKAGTTLPGIVLVHGGGWIKGDKTKFQALAKQLARKGYVVAAIEYRLAFEAKFPAAIRDCNAATAFLRQHAADWNIDPNRIAAVGGSAGGHLAGLMAAGNTDTKLHHAGLSNSESSTLKAVVVMAGPLQTASGSVAERSHDVKDKAYAVHWIGDTIDNAEEMYKLADAYEAIDKDMPPTLFITGSLDNPARNEPAREKMKSLGVPFELRIHDGAKHGHWNQSDWMDTVVTDIDGFLKKHLK